jgi:hypothetical protein
MIGVRTQRRMKVSKYGSGGVSELSP